MTEIEQLAHRIDAALSLVKRGALRFWGEWFGRPYDNMHRVVGCDANGDLLRLRFHEDELLSVWHPEDVVVEEQVFKIGQAARIRWEWFYYGRPKTWDHRYFIDFTRSSARVEAETNVDWYEPDLKPDLSQPAVEIL